MFLNKRGRFSLPFSMYKKKKNMIRHLCFLMLFTIIVLINSHSQIAKDKCKFIGNIIANTVPSDFSKYWNQVTPENSGKWGSVEATRNVMNWTALDRAYNYAKTNGFPFKQHAFVWGQQYPTWIDNLTSDSAKAAEVEEWIRLFCERYPDVDMIDVVNEPLHAPPSYKNAIGGNGSTGWDWVIWAFQKARQYCPNAKLLLNDYNIINSNSATTSYLQIINILKSRNLIDGIGEQGHFFESTPISTIEYNLNRLAATGLPIYISEYDVNIADDNQQLAKYQEQFPVFWLNESVAGITLWGYRQGAIWRTDAYLIRNDGTERPALTWLKNYVNEYPCFNKFRTAIYENVLNTEKYINIINPARNLTIEIDILNNLDKLIIIDINGKIIREYKDLKLGDNISIDLKNSGIYFVGYIKNDKVEYKKIIAIR